MERFRQRDHNSQDARSKNGHFNMSPSTFEWLSDLLEPLLDCRDPIGLPLNLSLELRLGIGLYRLSTGSDYLEIAGFSGLLNSERKELRGLAAAGVIHVVHPNWIEGCDCAEKEIPVMQKHMAHDALLPKGFIELFDFVASFIDSEVSNFCMIVTRVSRTDLWHIDCKDMLGSSIKGYTIEKGSMKLEKVFTMPSSMSVDPSSEFLRPRNTMLVEAGREQIADVNVKGDSFIEENLRPSHTSLSIRTDEVESQKKN